MCTTSGDLVVVDGYFPAEGTTASATLCITVHFISPFSTPFSFELLLGDIPLQGSWIPVMENDVFSGYYNIIADIVPCPDATNHTSLLTLLFFDQSMVVVQQTTFGQFTYMDHPLYGSAPHHLTDCISPLLLDASCFDPVVPCHNSFTGTDETFISSAEVMPSSHRSDLLPYCSPSPTFQNSPSEPSSPTTFYNLSPTISSYSFSDSHSIASTPPTTPPDSPYDILSPTQGDGIPDKYIAFISHPDSMTIGWSNEEKITGRRLVRFTSHRTEDSDQVSVNCEPVTREDYPNLPSVILAQEGEHSTTEVVVSCIYWRSGHHFCITSVDLIRLATILYGEVTTTGEKNRLRRHLEKLRPTTLGKKRDHGYELFGRIAQYREPRPVSIVKDVKVFKWEAVAEAMEAIKYKRHVG